MIDLHTHSTASDGTFSPQELIQAAVKKGLKAIALTDHDSVEGIETFQKEATLYSHITAVNGAELAVSYPEAEIEIIALNIQNLSPFQGRQIKQIQKRMEIALERLKKLSEYGMQLCFNDVALDYNGHKRSQIGKPHIVTALLQKGFIHTRQEGFALLSKNGPAYVPKKDPDLKETISFIRENGAMAILAHPCHTKLTNAQLYKALESMQKMGLSGIEVFHSDQNPQQTSDYFHMARNLGLLVSGGSDFHGTYKPEIQLGSGKGKLHVPDMLLEPLLTREKPKTTYYNTLSKIIIAHS